MSIFSATIAHSVVETPRTLFDFVGCTGICLASELQLLQLIEGGTCCND